MLKAGGRIMTPEGKRRLRADEGFSRSAYPDPRSPLAEACERAGLSIFDFRKVANWRAIDGRPWTCGVGCTGADIGPDTVWTDDQIASMFDARVAANEVQLRRDLTWFSSAHPVHQDVLVNIAFNVGVSGLEHWPLTLAHFAAGDAVAASNDLLHEGRWNTQVGKRADRLASATKARSWLGLI